ncbi:Sterol regulatory element-binding protein [Lachnellula hyalina]|uniref:Sterol regulatory element-binding protein n=1 Tax=Lachnellula hyalina TaxID=1316788 RepID=A0A8H8U130_9HELO|nr:Sterol regulatory element-binding protein [Lachnellula hyalina]TVY27487.1 Sterol regulatory element-binding protein [Lachnellula hyalina]
MPRPEHPPTPASSTEIRSKDGSQFFSLQTSFELPPPAVADMEFQPSGAATILKSGSSYHPASPKSPLIPASEVVKIRRRSSVAQAPPKDSFALPPPPTRSRKIIQMKPQQAEEIEPPKESPKYTAPKSTAPPKKKQPSSTSVAGRKIARKTAHSLIERRRRSKMNDEFGVLKDMIPACTGEMHKLAILQASIDYVRYLEDCVTKLQAENNRANPPSTSSSDKNEQFVPPRPARREDDLGTPRQYTQYEADGDIEMLGSEAGTSPTYTPTPRPISISTSTSISTSPALLPQNPLNRRLSYSPISPASHSNTHRHYSFSTSASTSASTSTSACASTTTSPALGPSTSTYDHARPNSTLTSPALPPQRNPSLSLSLNLDMDQEATVALLMLNTDRRGTSTSTSADARTRIESRGGMSVKDLIC